MADPSIPANVVQLTAAIFIGNCFNFLLMGALIVQSYYYYVNFAPTDRLRIQLVALFTFCLEVVQTFLVSRDAYILFCSRWGTPSALFRVGLIWLYLPIMGSLMSFVAQVFWAWRLNLLTKVKWIPGLIILFSVVQFVAGIVTGVIVTGIDDVTQLSRVFRSGSIWLVGTAIADVIIVVFMLYFFNKNRSPNVFTGTNALLAKVMFITVETGLSSAAVAVVDLIVFLTFQDQNWHLCVAIALSKVYANSLLLVLNSRKPPSSSEIDAIHTTNIHQALSMGSVEAATHFTRAGNPTGINISVAREIHNDQVHIPMVDMKPPVVPDHASGKDDTLDAKTLSYD
ncbi:hypothetical protein C8J56DRAFT_829735 [Mycena floridula]|nr:hypothetical protein C8J56DRAFT_829735 [Mycena floridula]